MKRLLSVVTIVVLLLLTLIIPASAYENDHVYNPYGILSPEEEQALESQLAAINQNNSAEFYVVVSQKRSDVYDYAWGDSVIFLVEYDEYDGIYYYELFLYGTADAEISFKESDQILDDPTVYNSIKSGNIYKGISRALKLTDTALNGRLITGALLLKTVLISLAISLIIAGIVCGIIIYRYKRKLKSPIYPLDRYAKLNLIPEDSRDTFLYKNVSRVRINTSSSSGSRSGGSRSGGSRGRR